MRNYIKSFITIGLFVSTCAEASVVKYENLNVASVRTLGAGNGTAKFLITTTQPMTAPGGLTCGNEFYAFDEADNPEMALSVALSAFMSGKKIYMYVYTNKCSANGRIAVRDIGLIGQ